VLAHQHRASLALLKNSPDSEEANLKQLTSGVGHQCQRTIEALMDD
jgi:hypothetical protein